MKSLFFQLTSPMKRPWVIFYSSLSTLWIHKGPSEFMVSQTTFHLLSTTTVTVGWSHHHLSRGLLPEAPHWSSFLHHCFPCKLPSTQQSADHFRIRSDHVMPWHDVLSHLSCVQLFATLCFCSKPPNIFLCHAKWNSKFLKAYSYLHIGDSH